jgi:hypothetical protein
MRDVVGYFYQASYCCPGCCLTSMLDATGGCTPEEIAFYPTHTEEALLDVYARRLGINRQDESTFDSFEFPKVIWRAMVRGDRCGICGAELVPYS